MSPCNTLEELRSSRAEKFTRFLEHWWKCAPKRPLQEFRDSQLYTDLLQILKEQDPDSAPHVTARRFNWMLMYTDGLIDFFEQQWQQGPFSRERAKWLLTAAYRNGFNEKQCKFLVFSYADNNHAEYESQHWDTVFRNQRIYDTMLFVDKANATEPLPEWKVSRIEKNKKIRQQMFSDAINPVLKQLGSHRFRIMQFLKTQNFANIAKIADALNLEHSQIYSAMNALKQSSSRQLKQIKPGYYKLVGNTLPRLYPRVKLSQDGAVYVGIFLGVNLHFTEESFDYTRHGPIPFPKSDYVRLPDGFFWDQAVQKFTPVEFEHLVIVTHLHEASWIGHLLSDEARELHTEWMRKMQSLSYHASMEMDQLREHLGAEDIAPINAWNAVNEVISMETFLLLSRANCWHEILNVERADEAAWLKVKKYERLIEAQLSAARGRFEQTRLR